MIKCVTITVPSRSTPWCVSWGNTTRLPASLPVKDDRGPAISAVSIGEAQQGSVSLPDIYVDHALQCLNAIPEVYDNALETASLQDRLGAAP